MSEEKTESMSEFERAQLELQQKWQRNIHNKEGGLKQFALYGDARAQPIDKSLLVFYTCGIPFSQLDLCEEIFATLAKGADTPVIELTVIVQSNLEDHISDWRRAYRSLSFVLETDSRVPALLARAGRICAIGITPGYFALRDDQQLFQLWAGLDERLKEGFRQSELISRLLNSSHMLLDATDSLDDVLDGCHLRDLYPGHVMKLREGAGSYAQAVGACLLSGACEGFDEQDATAGKKRVLVFCNKATLDAWGLCRRVIGGIDLDACDVTLLVPGTNKQLNPFHTMEVLPPEVRQVTRVQTFCCPSEDYVRVQSALESHKYYAHYADWAKTLDRRAAELEVRRMLGKVSFDALLYVGEALPLWYFVALGVDASVKKKLEQTDFVLRLEGASPVGNRFAVGMEMQADEALFDELCFVDEALMASAKKADPQLSVGLYDLVVDSENAHLSFMTNDEATYGGKPCCVVGVFDSAQRGFGALMELPSADCEGHAYLVDGVDADLLSCLDAIADGEPSGQWQAFTFAKQSSATRRELERRFPRQARLQQDMSGFGLYTVEHYLSHFKACVVPSEETHSFTRMVAEAYGMDVLVAQDGTLVPAASRTYASIRDAERYAHKVCERLCAAGE